MPASLKRQPLVLAWGDLALILAATQLAVILRFGRYINVFETWTGASIFTLSLYMLMMYMFDLYNCQRVFAMRDLVMRTAVAVVAAGLLSALLFYFMPSWRYIRGNLLIQMGLLWSVLLGWRMAYALIFPRTIEKEDVLIIGAGYAGAHLFQMLEHPNSPYRVAGFIDDDPSKKAQIRGFSRLLGTVDQIMHIASNLQIKKAILAITHQRNSGLMRRLLQIRCRGMTILDLPPVIEKLSGSVPVNHIREEWLIFAPGFYLLSAAYIQKLKRIIDCVVSAVLLIGASPFLLATALAIKLESPGPVFFTQQRVGLNNKVFRLWKFRSMVQNAEAGQAVWAQQSDPRVTRVGKMIRTLRIDEFPQLLNIFRGDMSLIGPRPERPEFVSELEKQIPYYGIRHSVRPGLTGWAQVNYPYGASVLDALHKLEYDLYYIKNMSLMLDITILLKTVGVVIFGQGAR